MESVIRQCSVKYPKEYAKSSNEGDDVFMCEYEYDIHWHSFKRLSEIEKVLHLVYVMCSQLPVIVKLKQLSKLWT